MMNYFNYKEDNMNNFPQKLFATIERPEHDDPFIVTYEDITFIDEEQKVGIYELKKVLTLKIIKTLE